MNKKKRKQERKEEKQKKEKEIVAFARLLNSPTLDYYSIRVYVESEIARGERSDYIYIYIYR